MHACSRKVGRKEGRKERRKERREEKTKEEITQMSLDCLLLKVCVCVCVRVLRSNVMHSASSLHFLDYLTDCMQRTLGGLLAGRN